MQPKEFVDCSVVHGELYLCKACQDDCNLLFQWANEEVTRKNSFNTAQIKYKDHLKWFDALMIDDNRKQYILVV